MEGVPYRSTMNKKIDKAALAARILGLEGISSEDKSALLELLSERSYGLYWENSPEEVETLLREKLPVLTEDTTKRILADATDEVPNHILIEGDNYPALVALQYAYEGKVDVIYIDPPYNTGNKDFVYNDSYVDNEDGYRHSKWLSFMSKRLRIAKRLLSDRGVIFISIDDNEQANLKLLCDELFGKNCVEQYIWCLQDKSEGSFVKTPGLTVRKEHEYIISCFKNPNTRFVKYKGKKEFSDGSFSNPDNDPRGPWFSGNISRNGIKSTTGSKYYTITNPQGISFTRNWTLSKEEYESALSEGRIYFANDGAGVPRLKIYASSDTELIQSSLFNDVHTSITGKNELKAIFEGEAPFNFPKPTTLIHRLFEITDPFIILDFFAGSGTTLHATMQLNAEDGGHRQCILVTNNENNICEEVTYERNKRVIQGYTTPKGQQVEGLKNNNLRYYKVDFVDREKTAANQKELMKASTDLLCIKENLYQEETCFEGLKLHPQIARCFSDGTEGGKKMLIIYEPAAIPAIVKRIEQMTVGKENKLKMYVMAEGQYPYTEDFESVLSKVELRAMPHALYQAMRQVLLPPAEAENTGPDMEVSDEEADGSIYKSEEL